LSPKWSLPSQVFLVRRWGDNIKIDVKNMGFESVDYTELVEDRM
jgi:hypothetical protein